MNNLIAPELKGHDVSDQRAIDGALSTGRHRKQEPAGCQRDPRISLAAARARAASQGLPLWKSLGGESVSLLPAPMMNIINGGAHADNTVDFQEFMIIPIGAPSFREGLRMGTEVFHHLKAVLKSKGLNTAVGDEGGFAPNLDSNEAALGVISTAVERAGYRLGDDIVLALDVASSEFLRDGRYELSGEGRSLTSDELVDFYADLCDRYPVEVSRMAGEDDWDGWKSLTDQLRRGRLWVTTFSLTCPSTRY